jgi:hypothetical protein
LKNSISSFFAINESVDRPQLSVEHVMKILTELLIFIIQIIQNIERFNSFYFRATPHICDKKRIEKLNNERKEKRQERKQ